MLIQAADPQPHFITELISVLQREMMSLHVPKVVLLLLAGGIQPDGA